MASTNRGSRISDVRLMRCECCKRRSNYYRIPGGMLAFGRLMKLYSEGRLWCRFHCAECIKKLSPRSFENLRKSGWWFPPSRRFQALIDAKNAEFLARQGDAPLPGTERAA